MKGQDEQRAGWDELVLDVAAGGHAELQHCRNNYGFLYWSHGDEKRGKCTTVGASDIPAVQTSPLSQWRKTPGTLIVAHGAAEQSALEAAGQAAGCMASAEGRRQGSFSC